jgi:hypothetical protein
VLRLVERLRCVVERVPVELLRVRLLAVRRVLLVPPVLLRRVLPVLPVLLRRVLLRRVPLVLFWVAIWWRSLLRVSSAVSLL